MKNKIILLFSVLICTFPAGISGRGFNGIDFNWSVPYGDIISTNVGIFNLSYYRPNPKFTGFMEFGITGMPEMDWKVTDLSSEQTTLSFVGIYTGHSFLMWRGLIRPGFHLGSVYETRSDYIRQNDVYVKRGRGSTSSFQPYFAFKLHMLFFSFIFSNKGLGAGLNFSI